VITPQNVKLQEPPVVVKRIPYKPPRVIAYGRVGALTLGGGEGVVDNPQSASRAKPPKS
jgi:hypothetical protein